MKIELLRLEDGRKNVKHPYGIYSNKSTPTMVTFHWNVTGKTGVLPQFYFQNISIQ